MRYNEHTLGKTVKDVLDAFHRHQGEMDLKPFGFDIYQGFEFFYGIDNRLYRKEIGAMIELSEFEQHELEENLAEGAVELYLRRPSVGLPPYPMSAKKMLHAATGRRIPLDDESMPQHQMLAVG